MGDQRCGVGFAHLRQTDDHGLAGLKEKVEKLRRHFVVVALVGGDEDNDIGEGGDFEQPRDVAG